MPEIGDSRPGDTKPAPQGQPEQVDDPELAKILDEANDPPDGVGPHLARVRSAWRREQKERKALERQLAERAGDIDTISDLRAENTFLKAGVPIDRALGKLHFEHYDGEMSVDAVRKSFAELLADANPGLAAQSLPSDDDTPSPDELARQVREAALSGTNGRN